MGLENELDWLQKFVAEQEAKIWNRRDAVAAIDHVIDEVVSELNTADWISSGSSQVRLANVFAAVMAPGGGSVVLTRQKPADRFVTFPLDTISGSR